jgi:hypothetical protein
MRKAFLWALAVLITMGAAVFQRLTGPTYPLKGKADVSGLKVTYRLDRSVEIARDHEVKVDIPDASVSGAVVWKRSKVDEPWVRVEMKREGGALVGALPKQPMGGRLEYRVLLTKDNDEVSLTGNEPADIRFKGSVPAAVLIPHVLIMFLAMLFSNRAGLAALGGKEKTCKLVLWTLALLFLGGFVFGPLVQKFSFGVFWAGVPYGFDLTDNKTLIAFLLWGAAAIAGRKGRNARGWVLAASILTLVIYMIPHSLLGSNYKFLVTPK